MVVEASEISVQMSLGLSGRSMRGEPERVRVVAVSEQRHVRRSSRRIRVQVSEQLRGHVVRAAV